MNVERVGVFGGSFNPPHVAHVLAAAYVLGFSELSRLVVVPVFDHAFDKDLASFEHRLKMTELALSWLPGVEVSSVEATLPQPSFTLNTLIELARLHPDWQLRLVIGSDVLHEKHKWHAFERIEALAPPLVLGRVGFAHPDAPTSVLPDVSSTRIRQLLAAPSSEPRDAELRAVVPRRVLEHVRTHGLYR